MQAHAHMGITILFCPLDLRDSQSGKMIGSNRSLGNCTRESINNPNNDRDKTNCSSSTTTTCCLVALECRGSPRTAVYLPDAHKSEYNNIVKC